MRAVPHLYELADEHAGVFTATEAADAGISHAALVMAARRGTVEPLSRGIYRLIHYPADQEVVQLWEAVLWPTVGRKPWSTVGVLSHLTALRLHFSRLEYTPPKVSITIPLDLRIRRIAPTWLDVHTARLRDKDVTNLTAGLPVTSLERTLFDCIAAKVDRRLIERVIDDALQRDELPVALDEASVVALRKALG